MHDFEDRWLINDEDTKDSYPIKFISRCKKCGKETTPCLFTKAKDRITKTGEMMVLITRQKLDSTVPCNPNESKEP